MVSLAVALDARLCVEKPLPGAPATSALRKTNRPVRTPLAPGAPGFDTTFRRLGTCSCLSHIEVDFIVEPTTPPASPVLPHSAEPYLTPRDGRHEVKGEAEVVAGGSGSGGGEPRLSPPVSVEEDLLLGEGSEGGRNSRP